MIGGFDFHRDGVRQVLPKPVQRVCALLALKGRSLHRSEVAGTLWPDLSEDRASANLRQVLWRASAAEHRVTKVTGTELALDDRVEVDVHAFVRRAQRLLSSWPEDVVDADLEPWPLRGELLPNVTDLWVIPYREELRELQASALETLCQIALKRGRVTLAIASARYAVDIDPLRESSWRCLVEAQIAHGNLAEAARRFREYARILAADTGLDPSPQFAAVVDRLWPERARWPG